jgi:hypothetical protein
MSNAGSLRVGHGEREQVVVQLTQQYAEGRLAAEEVEERTARARAARTVADLDRVVSDLPVVRPSEELRRARAATDLARLGTDPGHPLALSAGVASHVRRGVWTVPPYLALTTGLGTVLLDFQLAVCTHPVIDVSVVGGLGSVVLVLPTGWAAETDRLTKGMGTVSSTVDAVPRPGSPLLVLHGSCTAGAVRVRYPRWDDRRRMRGALRRGAAAVEAAGTRSRPFDPGWGAGPQDAPAPRNPTGQTR